MMSKIWLTADTHIGHKKIISYCDRPFSSIEEHDETIIKNWNSTVSRNDTVYHLGDFIFSRDHKQLMQVVKRLNGKIILVRGNHDDDRLLQRKDENGNNVISMLHGYHPAGQLEIKLNHEKYFLNHYPMRSWNARHYGRLHFFGHVHTSPSRRFLPEDGSYDVGVDNNNYTPVLLDDAIKIANGTVRAASNAESNSPSAKQRGATPEKGETSARSNPEGMMPTGNLI